MDTRKKRFARRLQVHFWKQGDEQPRSAYTTNVSTTGMFVCTGSPAAPGERVRIEVLDEANSFVIEGVVVHAARVSPLLRKLRESGMGVRFLRVDELIGAIVPAADVNQEESWGAQDDATAGGGEDDDAATGGEEAVAGHTAEDEAPAAATPGPAQADAAERTRPSDGRQPGERPDPPPEPTPASAPPTGTGTGKAEGDKPDAPPRQVSRGAPSRRPTKPPDRTPLRDPRERSYTLRFASLPSFLAVFERDIKVGGVYVTTQRPAKLHENVTIDIRVPEPVSQSLRARARVVHVVEAEEQEANLLAGMGVELADVERVVEKLNALIYD